MTECLRIILVGAMFTGWFLFWSAIHYLDVIERRIRITIRNERLT